MGVLTKTVPRFVIDEVLTETQRKEKRSRLLPAHIVVYFVMALALFRDGYDEVIRALVHGLRFARTWSTTWQVPTTGAISQARVRLGEDTMRQLFTRIAQPLASAGTPGAWLGTWRLMAIDGVMLDIPDTDANLTVYEKASGGTRRPYPQVKIVGLGECGTHALIDAEIGSIRQGERELAEPLIRSLAPNMLVMADRGFFSYELWRAFLLAGVDLVWRVTKTIHLPVLQVLPDGSYLSEIKSFKGPGKTRIPWGKIADPMLATHIPVRVIEYQVDAGDGQTPSETFRLITTILDPDQADAHEVAACYAQRWEFESSLREIECQLLEPGSTLRSKTPEMARQEIWGLFLTHYAVRAFMKEASDTIDIDPDRLSTIRAINIVRRSVTDPAEFSPRSTEHQTPSGDR
jgi:hypothetical protein